MSTPLHSLSDLTTLFGPDASVREQKTARAEAPRREDVAMEVIAHRREDVSGNTLPEPQDTHQESEEARVRLWLQRMVNRAGIEPVTVTITLTPILAQALLERNPDNRKISSAVVERYARDIATGRFTFNGESIIVSADGLLNDGQHRCAAVVKAGRPLRTVLVFGPERESRMTLGQGKVRLVADHIAMQGLPDSASYGAIAGYIWQYRTHKRLATDQYLRPTKAEILATVESYPDIADSMSSIGRQGAHLLGGRSLLAFCHWVFSRRDRDGATAFMLALGSGAGLSARDPILVARNRLLSRERLTPNEKAELIFRAWNAARRRETRASLQILGGQLPPVEA